MSDDLISRQAAIDALYSVDEYNSRSVKAIKQLPPIQPRRGKWIDTGSNEERYAREYSCSECGATMLGEANFCPNCGAVMEVTT